MFFAFLTLASCSDDEKKATGPLFTVTIPPLSVDPALDTWFFLTDNAGNLLGIQEAVDGLNIAFERPAGFEGKTFIVNKLEYQKTEYQGGNTYSDFYFTSYTGVSNGTIQLSPINFGSGTDYGTYSFNVSGVPSGYIPSGTSFSGTNGNFIGQAALFGTDVPILIWWKDLSDRNQVPRYSFVSNPVAGGSLITTFDNLSIADQITFSFGSSPDRVEFQVSPYVKGKFSNSFESFSVTNATNSKLYYPGSAFEKYSTSIRIIDNNQSLSYTARGAVPTTIKSMEATIDGLTNSNNIVAVTTTGSFDYLYMYGLNEWQTGEVEHWLIWYVYMDGEKTKEFKIPPFPQVLLERYPELASKTPNFSNVYIIEEDNIVGYREYLEGAWRMKSLPDFTESLTKARVFSQSGKVNFDLPLRKK